MLDQLLNQAAKEEAMGRAADQPVLGYIMSMSTTMTLSDVLSTGGDKALTRLLKKRCRELGITLQEAHAKHLKSPPLSLVLPDEAYKLREVLQSYAGFLGLPLE